MRAAVLQGELCKALGLENVVTLDLHFDLVSIPQVTVTFRPTPDQTGKATEVLKKFELVARKEDQ